MSPVEKFMEEYNYFVILLEYISSDIFVEIYAEWSRLKIEELEREGYIAVMEDERYVYKFKDLYTGKEHAVDFGETFGTPEVVH